MDSMVVQLTLIMDNLGDEEAGLQIEWMGVRKELRTFLEEEAGQEPSKQHTYVDDMIAEMYQLNPSEVRTFDPLFKEQGEPPNTSKTQGTPPSAQEARPTEEAATPVKETGRDKEGCAHWEWCRVDNRRRPSGRATADGEGTTNTVANSSTSSAR